MSTWGIAVILSAVSSYPAHQLPKNTASFVILCCYIVSLVHRICSSAVISFSTPQINLFHKNPCHHSIPYPFHFLPISVSSVFNLAGRSSHFASTLHQFFFIYKKKNSHTDVNPENQKGASVAVSSLAVYLTCLRSPVLATR